MEGLSGRQAAGAVRGRIDWMYALGLGLADPGFDLSVLSEFRSRLVEAGTDPLLDLMLQRLREEGLLKAGGRQRTDSTRVLAVIRTVNRLELAGEAVRAALGVLAVVAPDWPGPLIEEGWAERYGHRVEEYQLPKDDAGRLAHAQTIGADGARLLAYAGSGNTPSWLAEIPAIGTLRRVWDQQYRIEEQGLRWRGSKELAPSGERLASPYDPDARYGVKRGSGWAGYNSYLTQTCEPDAPHVITNLTTTAAQVADNDMTPAIHTGLAERDLLPDVHLTDPRYTGAELLVTSRTRYGVDLLGPAREDCGWRAKAGEGFDICGFAIGWEARTVTCPQGKDLDQLGTLAYQSRGRGHPRRFLQDRLHIQPGPLEMHRTKHEPRQLTLHTRELHEALHQAKATQHTESWKQQHALPSRTEDTISHAAQGSQPQRSRYLRLAKTHLQHDLTATANPFHPWWRGGGAGHSMIAGRGIGR